MLSQIRSYRRLSIGLAAILLFSVVGFHLDVHYCQGKLAGVSLVSPEVSECAMASTEQKGCCLDAEEEKGCCQDVEFSSSLDYDGLALSTSTLETIDISPVLVLRPKEVVLRSITYRNNLKCDPPDRINLSGQEVRIQFQSFLC